MDILTDSHPITRLEIVDTGRRRRWSDSEKVRIVEESLSAPRLASVTARRHWNSSQLLFAWRKAYREGRIGDNSRVRAGKGRAHVGSGLCIGIGGVRVDRAVAHEILDAVSERAVEAAILAADQTERTRQDVIAAVRRELEQARYETSLAERRYELVDPAKRHVARELETRWNDALERVAQIERQLEELSSSLAASPPIDRNRLVQLAHDLPAAWNAAADMRSKQRLLHIVIQEIVCNLDDATNEAVLLCAVAIGTPDLGAAKHPMVGVGAFDPDAGLIASNDPRLVQRRDGLVALGREGALRPAQHVHEAAEVSFIMQPFLRSPGGGSS
jgi:transposase-like protein